MLRLVLKLALAAAALWSIWAFVPFGGRTLGDRWAAAPDASAFVERTWAEMRGEPARERDGAAKPAARARSARETSRPRAAPAERHTEADRQAVDRILSEHLDDAPARR